VEKDLKILVVDDTVTYRQILSKIVSGFDSVDLLGIASNGKIAMSKIGIKQPDLVLLDVFMPEMDGLETLDQIKKQYPHIDVIMLSGVDRENANITMKALSSGALDFIAKPRGESIEENIAELKTALSGLILMARTRKYSRQARGIFSETSHHVSAGESAAHGSPPSEKIHRHVYVKPPVPDTAGISGAAISGILPGERRIYKKPARIDVVAIGVSTGGPNALQEIIPKIAAEFSVPILAVQHMPPMFTASLAARLNSLSAIKVVEAQEGRTVEKGVMYIAPGGRHLTVKKDRLNTKIIALSDSPPVNSCRPSVDVLFHSVAEVYGGNSLAVILTGMGNDGVAGVSAMRRGGSYSIVQDEKSSVIWGMPGAVVEADEANEIVPLDRMALRIMGIVGGDFR
jgi:two-component system, chemotaxis family, protein-glutamate methylesterase/glutaminase